MSEFFKQLFQVGLYKRNQGRITRQVTFASLAAVWALGMFRLQQTLSMAIGQGWAFGLPLLLFVVGLWILYRSVNIPALADFLIAVEAEMNKVSWPSRRELFRASGVVLITILLLTVVLTVYDVVWSTLFKFLHVV